ncbi:glycosyltransferase family 2 protein [Peribacillus simplex]|uniref:glycosyltransferase family 2 protein n=1 Tax=Peribacillus simplex TaxID=1478 RepID=UPI002989E7BC|nr:glycosyltransferase family 2 protein [Peribacillus simplex]MBX9954127.1 glycosyltransferase family 2 protein [Peribacillus simplex]
MLIYKVLLWLSIFLIFYSFIGYPLSLVILNKVIKKKRDNVNTSLKPFVSIIIPAHNEENVIEKKLNNLMSLNYPKDLMEIIIASDNSTDRTNIIVEKFINENRLNNTSLYKVKKRQGKTNAQNEAEKLAKGEILVFSDANAILDKDSIIHLVSSFTSEDIVYVTGRLQYVNSLDYISSQAENSYWNYDLFMRKVESNIKSITAGNGAIYAIRKSQYVDFNPIECHDSAMPLYAGIDNKRAVYNSNAIAYEKAGETSQDEFNRKVRMFRGILSSIFGSPSKYNFLKNGWFSYFYFGHRTLRYSLFILHIISFISNALLIRENIFYSTLFLLQCVFYILALCKKAFGFKNKLFYYPYYYCMTLAAQLLGAINQLTGKSKPFWEKAETTR